mmetsp:Transcript_29674/g.66538  ORF Transcript_29674/g.66538 Transcript_29674/m.66538 type:complete len:348 (-) Transcript_29674:93-1136(-)
MEDLSQLNAASLGRLVLAYLKPIDGSYFWPASYKSAPQWAAVCLVLCTHWALIFFSSGSPASLKRAEQARSAKTHTLMTSIISWRKDALSKQETESALGGGTEKEGNQCLPEAERLFGLLYDDTFECPTNTSTPLSHYAEIEDLFKMALVRDLKLTIKYTTLARAMRVGSVSGEGEEAVKLASDHDNGEKLAKSLEFVAKVVKKLKIVDLPIDVLAEAKDLLSKVYASQSLKRIELLKLIRPALPYMAAGAFFSVVNCSLRGYFHSIGHWSACIEIASTGNRPAAVQALFSLWLGHMVIEFIERLDSSYVFRAEVLFKQRVRDGVLSAMLSQDYEYFDKNNSGLYLK